MLWLLFVCVRVTLHAELYVDCRSGLIDLVNSWNNEVAQFYEDQILEQKRLYSQR